MARSRAWSQAKARQGGMHGVDLTLMEDVDLLRGLWRSRQGQ